jgi:Protein of unknown function (DUF1254)
MPFRRLGNDFYRAIPVDQLKSFIHALEFSRRCCQDFNRNIALFLLFGILLLHPPGATLAEEVDDRLLSTPASPEVIAKGLEADGYQLGSSAYSWGYPLVRMERVARVNSDVSSGVPATSCRAPVNKIGWARELATPSAKDMPTANNDTFYMSAVLDEPYSLSVPDTGDRYYVINVFNMWQELEHYIGRRTTGTKADRYILVPPGWTGAVPTDATRLDVSTNKVWLWGRLRIAQGESADPVLALQAKFTLEPVSGKCQVARAVAPVFHRGRRLWLFQATCLRFEIQRGKACRRGAIRTVCKDRSDLRRVSMKASSLRKCGGAFFVRWLTDQRSRCHPLPALPRSAMAGTGSRASIASASASGISSSRYFLG